LIPFIIFYRHDPRPRAYGVQYKHNGHYKKAHAHNEIILSAGAIASPQVTHYKNYNIPSK
jgi:choline dehydrogenase-like flavoprotein